MALTLQRGVSERSERSERPLLHFVLGLPGAGKTTATLSVINQCRGLTNVVWGATDMTSPDRVREMGLQRLPFLASSPTGRVVVLGAYHTAAAKRAHELRGPDKYSPPQRTRVKTLVSELAARGTTEHIVLDGLALLKTGGKPFQDRLLAVCDVHVHVLDTVRSTCQARFQARNECMVREQRLAFYPTSFCKEATWDKIETRMCAFIKDPRVAKVHHHATATAAATAIMKALQPC